MRPASIPAITAASADAINQYGLASDAPVRNSMRVASPSISERTAEVRLSWLQVNVAGAKLPGA